MHAFTALNLNIEIAHEIVGEVIFGQLEQQLIFIHGIGCIDHHVEEGSLSLVAEFHLVQGIAIIEHFAAPLPHVFKIELTIVERLSRLNAIDNHARHGGEWAVGMG